MAKKLKLELPSETVKEISDVALKTDRSTAFIAHRALVAAKRWPPPPGGAKVALELTTNEDDRPDVISKIEKSAAKGELADRLASAWADTRQQFLALIQKSEAAAQAERADDLDAELAEAKNQQTNTARLTALSRSVYPRVRILVAEHKNVPKEVLSTLAKDREPAVRKAAER